MSGDARMSMRGSIPRLSLTPEVPVPAARLSRKSLPQKGTLIPKRKRMVPLSEVEMPPHGLTTQQRKEVERAFRTFDTDGSGSVDAFELKLAMRALGMKASEEEISYIMDEVDVDRSGEIDLDEFMEVVRPGIGGKDTLQDVKKCFYDYFDVSGDGRMDMDEFKNALPCFGADEWNDREIRTAFAIADKGDKGYVDEIDWIDLCSELNLGPSYNQYEMAEVTLIRESLEKTKSDARKERWDKIAERGGVEYNYMHTLPSRLTTMDVHELIDTHADPATYAPPPLPPSVERRTR